MNKENILQPMELHEKLKAHNIGDLCLTITTVILVIVSLCFSQSFAPFIILLMASRIGNTVFTLVKAPSKKEILKLILWLALLTKSIFSYCNLLGSLA